MVRLKKLLSLFGSLTLPVLLYSVSLPPLTALSMSIAKLSLTSRQLTDLLLTSRFEYWAELEGSGLVEGVKNVAAPSVYRQAMAEAVKNLQFLGLVVLNK